MNDERRQRFMDWLYPPGEEHPRMLIASHLAYDEDGNCRVVNSLSGESSSVEEVREALEGLGRRASEEDPSYSMTIEATASGNAPACEMTVELVDDNGTRQDITQHISRRSPAGIREQVREAGERQLRPTCAVPLPQLLSGRTVSVTSNQVAFDYPQFTVRRRTLQDEVSRLDALTAELESVDALTPATRRLVTEARALLIEQRIEELTQELGRSLEELGRACESARRSTEDFGRSIAAVGDVLFSTPHPAADRRARALLLRHLTPVQATCYRATGSFLVQGSLGGVYRINSGRSINVESVAGRCPVATWAPRTGSNGRLLRSKKRRIWKKAGRAKRRGEVRCALGAGHDGALEECVCVHDDNPPTYPSPRTKSTRYCLELPNCPIPDQLLAQKLLIEADEGSFLRQARKWATSQATSWVSGDASDSWGWRVNPEGGIVEEWGDRREALRLP